MAFQYGVNTARALWSYHNQKRICGNYPMIQDVEVTNSCNLDCSFCERDLIKKRGIGYMTEKTFHNIVNAENKPLLRHTRLFMHGEPLLHPKIVDFVSEAKQFAKTVGFTTNGLLLTESKSKELLEVGLDSICISGHTREIAQNIHNFLTVKKEGNSQCHTTLAIIDPTELPLTSILNQEGIDKVTFLKLHDWGLHGKRTDVCLWPWWGLGVWWDGRITPCCLNEDSHINLGNVNTASIRELWNSDMYRWFRHSMLIGEACRSCGLSSNTFVDGYLRVHKPNRWNFLKGLWQIGKQAW